MKSIPVLLLSLGVSAIAGASEIATLLGRPDATQDFVQRTLKESLSVDAGYADPEVEHSTHTFSLLDRGGVREITNVEVLSLPGVSTRDLVVQGLRSGARKAGVVLAPLGPTYGSSAGALCAALDNSDTVYVFPAGNEAQSLDSRVAENPDCFRENVIRVAALDEAGVGLAFFSNFGKQVEVAAPGTKIPVVGPGGEMTAITGSSLASTLVAARLVDFARQHSDLRGAPLARAFLAAETQALPSLEGKIAGARALSAPKSP